MSDILFTVCSPSWRFTAILPCILTLAVYTVSVTFFRPNVIKFKFGGVKAPGVKSSKGKEVDIIVETDVHVKIISLSRMDLIANKCLHQKLQ